MSYQPVTAGGAVTHKAQTDLAVTLIQACNGAEAGYPIWIRNRDKRLSVRLRAHPRESPQDPVKFSVDTPTHMEGKFEERRIFAASIVALLSRRGLLHPDQEM